MRKLVWTTIIVLASLAVLIVLWEFRLALALFLFSLAMTASTRPVVAFWVRHRIPHTLAVLLTYLIGLILIGALGYLVGGLMLIDLRGISDAFARGYERLVRQWPEGSSFQRAVAEQLPPPQDLYIAIAGEQGTRLMQNILGVAQGFFLVAGQFFMVIVLSLYWSIDQAHFERLWLSLVPARNRNRARHLWRTIESGVGAYVRSEILQSLLVGIVLGLGYRAAGLPYPILTAAVNAVLWLIPWLGLILALILPVINGLSVSPALALFAGGFTLVVLLVSELFVQPRLFDRQRYSSLLVVIFVVALADAFGILGLLLAPPLAAAVQILFTQLVLKPSPSSVASDIELSSLQQRLDQLRERVRQEEAEPPAEMLNMLERLQGLIRQARSLFDETPPGPALDLPAANKNQAL